MAVSARRPREYPRSETRHRILAAARELFAAQGFEATTVKMIAHRCGITDPALYYHFQSKRQIHDALLVQPILEHLPTAGPPALASVVDGIVDLFFAYAAEPDLMRMLLREQMAGGAASLAFREQSLQNYRLHLAVPLGRLYGEDAGPVSDLIFGLLAGALWDGLLTYGPQFEAVAQGPYLRQRVRELVAAALPRPRPLEGTG